jgi:hypothetical protein
MKYIHWEHGNWKLVGNQLAVLGDECSQLQSAPVLFAQARQ